MKRDRLVRVEKAGPPGKTKMATSGSLEGGKELKPRKIE